MAGHPTVVTEEMKERMHALLVAGNSQYAVARELGIKRATIDYHSRKMGIAGSPARLEQLKAALAARPIYTAAMRAADILRLRNKWSELLDGDITAKDLRDLAVTLGITIDKQRLEEGLSSVNVASRVAVEYETTAEQRSAIRAALLGADHARLPPASE